MDSTFNLLESKQLQPDEFEPLLNLFCKTFHYNNNNVPAIQNNTIAQAFKPSTQFFHGERVSFLYQNNNNNSNNKNFNSGGVVSTSFLQQTQSHIQKQPHEKEYYLMITNDSLCLARNSKRKPSQILQWKFTMIQLSSIQVIDNNTKITFRASSPNELKTTFTTSSNKISTKLGDLRNQLTSSSSNMHQQQQQQQYQQSSMDDSAISTSIIGDSIIEDEDTFITGIALSGAMASSNTSRKSMSISNYTLTCKNPERLKNMLLYCIQDLSKDAAAAITRRSMRSLSGASVNTSAISTESLPQPPLIGGVNNNRLSQRRTSTADSSCSSISESSIILQEGETRVSSMLDTFVQNAKELNDPLLVQCFEAARELWITEVQYVHQLEILGKEYESRLSYAIDMSPSICTEQDKSDIFLSRPIIEYFNRNFILNPLCEKLLDIANSNEYQSSKIGDVILAFATTFTNEKAIEVLNKYYAHCGRYASATEKINDLRSSSGSEFNTFISDIENLSALKHKNLSSLMIRPVQRICRYSLLLEGIQRPLLKYSKNEISSIDNPSLLKAIDELNYACIRIKEVTEKVNHIVAKSEKSRLMQEVFEELGGKAHCSGLLQSSRIIVLREINVRLYVSEHVINDLSSINFVEGCIYFFNDIIIGAIANGISLGTMNYRNIFTAYYGSSYLIPDQSGKTSFAIGKRGLILYVSCQTASASDVLKKEFENAREKDLQNRSEIESRGQKAENDPAPIPIALPKSRRAASPMRPSSPMKQFNPFRSTSSSSTDDNSTRNRSPMKRFASPKNRSDNIDPDTNSRIVSSTPSNINNVDDRKIGNIASEISTRFRLPVSFSVPSLRKTSSNTLVSTNELKSTPLQLNQHSGVSTTINRTTIHTESTKKDSNGFMDLSFLLQQNTDLLSIGNDISTTGKLFDITFSEPKIGLHLHDDKSCGVRVTLLIPGSESERLGVKVGDILESINGTLPSGTFDEVQQTLHTFRKNGPLTLTFRRPIIPYENNNFIEQGRTSVPRISELYQMLNESEESLLSISPNEIISKFEPNQSEMGGIQHDIYSLFKMQVNFIQSLQILVKNYLIPLREALLNKSHENLCSTQVIESIFSNLPLLIPIEIEKLRIMMQEFQKRNQNDPSNKISNGLKAIISGFYRTLYFMKVYYSSIRDINLQSLITARSKNNELNEHLIHLENDSPLGSDSLASLVFQPIRNIHHIFACFSSISRHLQHDNSLSTSFNSENCILLDIIDIKRHFNVLAGICDSTLVGRIGKLLKVYDELGNESGCPKLLQFQRKLIKRDDVSVISEELLESLPITIDYDPDILKKGKKAYLFDDHIIVAKKLVRQQRSNGYKVLWRHDLQHCSVIRLHTQKVSDGKFGIDISIVQSDTGNKKYTQIWGSESFIQEIDNCIRYFVAKNPHPSPSVKDILTDVTSNLDRTGQNGLNINGRGNGNHDEESAKKKKTSILTPTSALHRVANTPNIALLLASVNDENKNSEQRQQQNQNAPSSTIIPSTPNQNQNSENQPRNVNTNSQIRPRQLNFGGGVGSTIGQNGSNTNNNNSNNNQNQNTNGNNDQSNNNNHFGRSFR